MPLWDKGVTTSVRPSTAVISTVSPTLAPSAQAAFSAWVQTYNYARPHQSLDMATPASLFRPNAQPEPLVLTAPPDAPGNQDAADAIPTDTTGGADSGLVLLPSAGAVEFDTVIAASGLLAVIPSVQRISLGPKRGGQRAHVWVDEYTVHILVDGALVKTVPSNPRPPPVLVFGWS